MLEKLYNTFSNDIGIDLGTANTLVYLKGHGIVINEPSVVAVNQKTGRIVAVGAEAKQMLGRTPAHIRAVRPIVDGVISDFEVTEEMLSYLITKAEKISKKFFRPRVYDAAKSGGAREVYIIEEPMAAALGIHLPVKEAVGSMIMDIGGGTTDIAIIALGGIVRSKNSKIAGDRLNNDITSYLRDEFKLLIGEKTAENVKIAVGSVFEGNFMEAQVRGRDLVTGLPREVIITDSDVREAIMPSITILVDDVREVLETTPPEILSDVMNRGLVLSGGGALISGLDRLLENTLKIPIYVAEDPLTAVVRGAGVILDEIENYSEQLISVTNDLPPR